MNQMDKDVTEVLAWMRENRPPIVVESTLVTGLGLALQLSEDPVALADYAAYVEDFLPRVETAMQERLA